MTSEPHSVVVVPFPFSDRMASKRRPALALSSSAFNTEHKRLVLTMITSARSHWPSDVPIRQWTEAGLRLACKVRFKLFTLDADLIVRRLGGLAPRDGDAVRRGLGAILPTGTT